MGSLCISLKETRSNITSELMVKVRTPFFTKYGKDSLILSSTLHENAHNNMILISSLPPLFSKSLLKSSYYAPFVLAKNVFHIFWY
jgi:hypothetical protein